MSKTIWVVILIIVVVLLWYLFRGDSAQDVDVTPEEDGTEVTDDNAAAAVEATGDATEDAGEVVEDTAGEEEEAQ